MGNPIVRNDQVGLLVGRLLAGQGRAGLPGDVEFREFTGSPLALAGQIQGFQRVALIDSILTGRWPPGTVVSFSREELLDESCGPCPHGLNVPAALAAALRLGLHLPRELHLVGIEVGSLSRFGEVPEERLASALPAVAAAVLAALRKLLGAPPLGPATALSRGVPPAILGLP